MLQGALRTTGTSPRGMMDIAVEAILDLGRSTAVPLRPPAQPRRDRGLDPALALAAPVQHASIVPAVDLEHGQRAARGRATVPRRVCVVRARGRREGCEVSAHAATACDGVYETAAI